MTCMMCKSCLLQVAKLAVSLAGKTMEDSYNGFITLTYQSGACGPTAMTHNTVQAINLFQDVDCVIILEKAASTSRRLTYFFELAGLNQ